MTVAARTGHTELDMLGGVVTSSQPVRLTPVADRDKALKDHLERTHPLRRARAAAGLTQKALGDLVGVEQPHIARWESGSQLPRVDRAVRLASVLGTTVEALWPGDRQSCPESRKRHEPESADFQGFSNPAQNSQLGRRSS